MKFLRFFYIVLFIFSIQLFAQPNEYVILVSYDGFRWDYMNRGITPNLEKVKEEGVSPISLRSCFPTKTFPNHIAIATGMFPENHGIISNDFENPFTEENYRIGDPKVVKESKWYQGEFIWETLERNNIRTASYFWPGSEISLEERHPSIYKPYEHKYPYYKRVDSLISWLQLPEKVRPHFLTLYFDLTDTYGHKYGPNSKETNWAIASLDSITGYLVKCIDEIGLTDKVNLIFVSDHGMTEISNDRIVNIETFLKGYDVKYYNDGPIMMVKTSPSNREEVYELLKKQDHFVTYKKEDMPDFYKFNKNPFISDIVLVADLGWSLVIDKSEKKVTKYNGKGNHGFAKDELDMHGYFVAKGPSFKKGFTSGTIWNIDIYPLICKIFSVEPRSNIDGKLERVEFLLKEK